MHGTTIARSGNFPGGVRAHRRRVFVRDPRVATFRRTLAESGRFSDGITDAIYRLRRAFTPTAG